jgi:hypothetical protein
MIGSASLPKSEDKKGEYEMIKKLGSGDLHMNDEKVTDVKSSVITTKDEMRRPPELQEVYEYERVREGNLDYLLPRKGGPRWLEVM